MKKVQITLAVLLLSTLAFTNVNAQTGTDTGGQTTTTTENSADEYEDDNDSNYGAWGLLGLLGLAGLIPRKDKLVNHNTNNPSR